MLLIFIFFTIFHYVFCALCLFYFFVILYSKTIISVIGYGRAANLDDGEGELRKKFLVFLKMGGETKEVNVMLPSISILIQEAGAKRSKTDRITYCYDQLMSKVRLSIFRFEC